MSSNPLLNILVEAKNEYMATLAKVMCPSMIDTFRLIYAEAVKVSKGKKPMIITQTLLKEILHWNHHMIKEHTETITSACAWFEDLIAAIFVGYIKILSSVRITNDNRQFATKVPNTDLFVHRCYIECAKDLYNDPFILQKDDFESYGILYDRMTKCLNTTIRDLIPMQQILDTYISKTNIQQSNPEEEEEEEEDEDTDPELFTDDPSPETETETETPQEEATEEQRDVIVNNKAMVPDETSNISTESQQVEPPQPDDKPVLFSDAPVV